MNALTTIVALIAVASAWSSTGHFLTALIAQIELKRDSPQLYAKLEEIVGVLSGYTAEEHHKFVECAEFADDIKNQNWKAFNSWHYNTKYYFNGVPKKDLPIETQNVVWAIDQAIENLNTNKPGKINEVLGKSFSIRYLIHLVADLHQPLHNATLVNSKFPTGDMGGNLFKIKDSTANNLHSFWDLCLRRYRSISAPISDDNFEYLSGLAEEIMGEYTREKLAIQLGKGDLEEWAAEGLTLAEEYAYNGIQPNHKPSVEYIERGFAIVKQQLALGGYRLTDILKGLTLDAPKYVLSEA